MHFLLIFSIIASTIFRFSRVADLNAHFELRRQLIHDEEVSSFGGKLHLNEQEVAANKVLMAAKWAEIDAARADPAKFLPSRSFLDVRQQIERSKVFQMIRRMPKGAVLHAHSTAIASFDFIVANVIFMPNLYVCFSNEGVKFEFFEKPRDDCDWRLLEEVRLRDESVDDKIRRHLTFKNEENTDDATTWKKFESIFETIKGLITYRPAFEMYLQQALKELCDDNVMYIELRSAFPKLYELNGVRLEPLDAVKIYRDVIDEFKASHPDFVGVKLTKEKSIAIELNPISNQFFKLVQDLQNHPLAPLLAQDYPIVVSSDDPGYWGASGLSHDFYEAFLGMMSRRADLRALKQLAINSIVYSKMSEQERERAYEIWRRDWDRFVKDLAGTTTDV